jgi:hypothetical protein
MFIRAKSAAGRTYYQVVESYRDAAGVPRHRTIASLGRHPTPAAALAAAREALARARRELAEWQPHALPSRFAQQRVERARKRVARLEAKISTLTPIRGLEPGRGNEAGPC